MKLIINQDEIKQAVVNYLKEKLKIDIKPDELMPVFENHNDYDQTTSIQVGFSIENPFDE